MRSIKVLSLVFTIIICSFGSAEHLPATALAQEAHTTISGVVLDANDARIAGATVKIKNSKVSRLLKTDYEGSFRVDLPSGEYKISAEQEGFRRFEFSPFRAKASVCELVNIHMEIKAPRSTLKVN
ncbi:MAG TPA: carboxypeptidase-like regulatory domain-containing protein [Pyrinomonadaceae bacterium]|nr:carboxypeptidase-like regulatory domain-containing protein [Pyrinomonadaceae bacterium]